VFVIKKTTTPYTLIDGNQRPVFYMRGAYPALVLDHTVTSNANHGPTIQFTHNGLERRQWLIGTSGDGTKFDMGFSNATLANDNYNPHNGIAGYLGITWLTVRENGRIGLGWAGDWGAYGANAEPLYPFHFVAGMENGHSYLFRNTGAVNGAGAIFVNNTGNHSWGVVAEFRIDGTSGTDRPSILFSHGYNSTTWSVGFGYTDDFFRINQNHGHRSAAWGTTRFRIGTDGGVGVTNYQWISGQTTNTQSYFQWEGATFRNPGDHTPSLLIRADNSTTGLNGSRPALALYNNDGGDQTTVGMSFVSAEGATGQGNSVALAGIIAKKESSGTVGGWTAGSLNFYVKNFANRIDAINIAPSGMVSVPNVLRVETGSLAVGDAATRGLVFDGNYSNGQYRHRWRKQDPGAGLPLYLDYAHSTANAFTNIARFGGGGSYREFSVYGTQEIIGNIASPTNYFNGLQLEIQATSGTAGIGLHRSGFSHCGIYHNTSNVLGFNFNDGTVLLNHNTGTIWGSGNDGAGSGLDADTLDGVDSSGYWTKSGGWYGSGLPGSRLQGISASGGEFVLGDGLPNAGQIGVLIDGAYVAAENNGFWSLASDNTWGSRRGFSWDGSAVNFTTNNPRVRVASIDLNNSSYYMTQGDWGWRHQTPDGWIQFGPANSGHAHIYTDRSNFYFNVNTLYTNGNLVWTSANDGSGTGLDADLLDGWNLSTGGSANTVAGRDGSARLYSHLGALNSNNDWAESFRATPVTGYTWHGDISTGGPQGTWWFYESMRHSNSSNFWGTQIAWGWEDNANQLFQRNITGNSFSSWVKYWNSGNDGAGSGLDADLLDGISSGSFTRNDTSQTLTNIWYFRSNQNHGGSNPPLQAYSSDSGGAIMAFHRGGYYAVNMGLDSDNVLRIGGWSAASNRLQMDMSGNLTMAGNVTAYSDIRLKTDIQVIENAIEKVKQIRGVTFKRIDEGSDGMRQTGVIAQEVELVLPEAVSQDNEGIKNVAYGNMIGLLIEAIKEQQKQIDALTAALLNKNTNDQ
jgi:hypothetical protein